MSRQETKQGAKRWPGRWQPLRQKGATLAILIGLGLLAVALGLPSARMVAQIDTTPTSPTATLAPTATNTALPPTAPPPPLVQVSKRVYLWRGGDGDETISTGDELLYAFTVTNLAGETVGAVVLRDELELGVTLLPGTITTSRGHVVAGNATGDTEAVIGFGDLAAGSRAEAQLRALVTARTTGQVANQAVVSYRYPVNGAERFSVSDNPDTAELNDPTIIQVRPSGPTVYLPMIGRD
jgi:uncharacterized repeat protein (TIGR01451 family)